jgi:hypothetical protein
MPERLFEQPDWDATVAGFPTGTIYHSAGWLKFLEQTQAATSIVEAFDVPGASGFHVAAKLRKGPFTILGSPLPGWTTARMGPLFDPATVDQNALIAELEAFGRRSGASMFEVANENLDADAMRAAGFESSPDGTFIVDLPETEDELWNNLRSTCRNRVRKGRNNGLTVEIGIDDALVNDVWERVQAVFHHQELVVSYDRGRVQALYDIFAPLNQVVGIRVRAPDGHIAACGIFPFDEQTIYFWAGAARPEDRALVPNELMHWSLMRHAQELGLKHYDMCGGGDYKKKFGAYHVKNPHWIRYYNPAAKLGRATMAKILRSRRAVAGRIPWLRSLIIHSA